jgi:hypothetical protein
MGGVGSELFFDQVDDQLSDFATKDKEEIFKYTTFDRKGTHISNLVVWHYMEDGKEADSVQRQNGQWNQETFCSVCNSIL